MNLKPLPDEIWELILSNDTTNLALDAVNHDWLRIMKCIRKCFPHGHFEMPRKRLFVLMNSNINEDKVLLTTALFNDRIEGNDSCIFSIDIFYIATLCRAFHDENLHLYSNDYTLIYIWCDKYKKEIKFRAQLSENYNLEMQFPFCTNASIFFKH